MPDEESKEGSSAKWAREAFDFLKFFRREQKNLSGLIILQIGWALLLGILAKLGPQDEAPILGIPWPSNHWHARPFPLTSVYSVGAAVITLYWLFSSGVEFYVRLFLFRLFRYPLVILCYVLLVPLLILSIPFWLLSWPLELWLIKKWERDPKRDQQKLAAFKKDRDKKTYLSFLRKQVHFRADWFIDGVGSLFFAALFRLASPATLGLAPLYSYSYEEDEGAAKVPMQLLAAAMGRLRIKLRYVESLRYIRFRMLPSFFSVPNPETAHFLRRWLGLDAIVWGSYLTAKPPRIWLNIELPPRSTKDDPAPDRSLETFRAVDIDPFSSEMDLDPRLEIYQDHIWDAYVALLTTIALVMQSRQARKFTLYPKAVDRLYYSHADANAILINLVKEALFFVEPAKRPLGQYTSVVDALVSIAGVWIAKQLGDFAGAEYSDDFELLLLVARRCIEIHPEDAGGYYRLAAILCVLGKEEEVKSALRSAGQKDKNLHWIGWTKLYAWAYIAILDLDSSRYRSEELRIARAYVYSWRAVQCGGDKARESLRKDLEKRLFHVITEKGRKVDSLGAKLLYKLLPEPVPSSSKQD